MISLILWDASALSKMYGREAGSEVVDAIFQAAPPGGQMTTIWGYAECCSILLRKRNGGLLTAKAYEIETDRLTKETLTSPDFNLFSIDDTQVLAGITLIERHHLNAADGAILATFLRYANALPSGGPTAILVAADRRLLRAAAAEGLRT